MSTNEINPVTDDRVQTLLGAARPLPAWCRRRATYLGTGAALTVAALAGWFAWRNAAADDFQLRQVHAFVCLAAAIEARAVERVRAEVETLIGVSPLEDASRAGAWRAIEFLDARVRRAQIGGRLARRATDAATTSTASSASCVAMFAQAPHDALR